MLDDSYDSDFPYPHLDPVQLNALNVRFIGQDRAQVEIKAEKPVHWSERQAMGYVGQPRQEYPEGDRMPDGSDEQGWDKED